MTTSSTQLGDLDLAAFYMQAKSVRAYFGASGHSGAQRSSILDLCDKLTCVIDAIRADGLDPRWHPERDALVGLQISGPFAPEKPNRYEIRNWNADDIIRGLRERGYKIVKDDK